jgi:hypothetical protein
MAQACNPSYSEGGDGENYGFKASLGKKFLRPLLNTQQGEVVPIQGSINRRIKVQANPSK